MIKKISLVLLITVLSIYSSYAYEPEELPSLVGDFALSYTILNQDETIYQGATLDGIKIIRLFQPDEAPSTQPYKLYLYIDRDLIINKENIPLPYDFKWNFKGLSEETHEFLFIIKATDNTIGVIRLDVVIKH